MELFEQALVIFKEPGDRAGQGTTLHGLGNCYYSLCQHAKAMELYDQPLATLRSWVTDRGRGRRSTDSAVATGRYISTPRQ